MDGLTAPGLLWRAAGTPSPKWPLEPAGGRCATCAAPVSEGVSHLTINSTTFSQQGDFFQYGTHCCPACAWLYSDAKRHHRSVLAVGDTLLWPLLSVTAAAEQGRPSWLDTLRLVAATDPATPCAGVLTTDPKPRFWPRTRLASAGAFGLYAHAPDYDTSNYVRFDAADAVALTELILPLLRQGYSKRTIARGLWADYPRATRDLAATVRDEQDLAPARRSPAFVPALLAAGLLKEDPRELRPDRGAERPRAPRRGAPADGARLL